MTDIVNAPAEAIAPSSGVGAGKPVADDPPAFDRAGLESSLSGKLAAAFADEDTTGDDVTPLTDNIDDTASEETAHERDSDAGDDAQDTLESGAATDATPQTAAQVPTLPAAYRRSLKALEWSDEEIDANFATLGPKFLDVAAKLHTSRNKEVSQWAEAGRAARQQNAGQQQQQPLQQMQPIDAAKLKEQYGEDAVIDALIGPINTAIQQMNAALPLIVQTQEKSQQAEMETLGRHVETFFGSAELKPYASLYGDNKTATDEQITARNKVLEAADAMIAGAKLQKRSLTLDEALQLAHDSVSGNFKVQASRTQIKNQLQKREKGITLKPSGKRAPASDGTLSESDRIGKVQAGLAKAFG